MKASTTLLPKKIYYVEHPTDWRAYDWNTCIAGCSWISRGNICTSIDNRPGVLLILYDITYYPNLKQDNARIRVQHAYPMHLDLGTLTSIIAY